MEEEKNKQLGELLFQLAKGNAQVLNEISDKFERVLKSIATIYYTSFADVQDAIHDFYVKLQVQAIDFRTNDNAASWIAKSFKNFIKSDLKRRRREAKYVKAEISHLRSNVNVVDERYVETHLYIKEIFDKLTRAERNLIVYYYWCGFTVRELEEILHRSKSAIHKSLKKLEEKVKNFLK